MPASGPLVGLSLMLEKDFPRATLPLFQAGEVEILEWSFDIGWPHAGPAGLPAGRQSRRATMPGWACDLLDAYSDAERLLGHGVCYSPLSAGVERQQDAWLRLFADEVGARRYRHVSEHFGFSSTSNFHDSAPLPVPLTETTLKLGRLRLQRLAEIARVPIGLENLAFAFSRRDVEDQGRFLADLLAPIDGFLLLDLHNVYCQVLNFDSNLDELLTGYPLERVRELHVSGGSSSQGEASPRPIRRDTHDGPVPEELFAWLPAVLQRCPKAEAVILERLGGTMSPADDEQFRRDFLRLKEAVHAAC